MAFSFVLSLFFLSLASAYDWSGAEAALKAGITDGAYPGYSAMVAYKGNILYKGASGTDVCKSSNVTRQVHLLPSKRTPASFEQWHQPQCYHKHSV